MREPSQGTKPSALSAMLTWNRISSEGGPYTSANFENDFAAPSARSGKTSAKWNSSAGASISEAIFAQ